MDFLCPSCQKMLTVPDQYAGTKMKCPLCASQFAAPSLPSPASAPAAGPFSTPPPPPPPPSVPIPPPLASSPPAGGPPSSPGEYRHLCSMPLDPRIIPWIAPAALLVAFVIQLFFSYTGMYPAGHAVYTQGAWGAAFGGRHAEDNPLWDKMAEQNANIPAVVLRQEPLPWQFFMVLYVLVFFPLSLALCLVAAVVPLVTMPLPPIVNQIKPWRWAIAGGVASIPFLLLVLQMILGFGLEQKAAVLVDKKMPGAAAPVAPAAGQPPAGQTAPPQPVATTLTDEDKTKLAMAHAAITGAQVMQRTTWLKLTLFLHVLAIAAAGVMFWLDRRAGQGKPVPRLEARW